MSDASASLALSGAVTIANYTAARQRAGDALAGGDVTVDWSAVDEVDSSALSLIFYMRRQAAANHHQVRHEHLPHALDALADLYGVADLLA
jgi:phospholipid transport system transporter-binding protein